MRNGNFVVEVDCRKPSENKKFAHERLNISKGIIRNRELVLTTEEEMAAALGKQGINIIVSIKKGSEKVKTNV